MSGAVVFHVNKLADGTTKETYLSKKEVWWDRVKNYFHKGVHCVRRCGFHAGNFSIYPKQEMIERKEYDNKTGCNGIAWVAFEGSHTECEEFKRQNQTYMPRDD